MSCTVTIDLFGGDSSCSSEEEDLHEEDAHQEEARQEEGQEEAYTPTKPCDGNRARLVQRTISVTCGGLGDATDESPRVNVSFHTRKYPRPRARKTMDTLTPNFKYKSLSVWSLQYRTVVSRKGRKLTIVSSPEPTVLGTGKWWDPLLIE